MYYRGEQTPQETGSANVKAPQPAPSAFDALRQGAAARQSGRGMIRSRIERLRREADGLESLLRSIPEELPFEADEALWSMAARRD